MEQLDICVLGGSGHIGREICRLAVAMGHRVVSVSRRGRPRLDQPWLEGVEWISADVGDPSAWRDHLPGCEALVYCVGIAREDPVAGQTFERLHIEAADRAAREAEQAGVPTFVYLSASTPPAAVAEAYLTTKHRAEQKLEERDLDLAILRPALVYGGGALEAADLRFAAVDADEPGRRALPREKVAIAALRAALEPETTGIFEVDDIDHLGDAMFLQ